MTQRVYALEDPSLGNRAYLLVVGGGLAAAIDPPRDTEALLSLADRHGLRVVASLETHLHADFVGGSRELAERTGADVYAAKDADLRFGHIGVGEGDLLRVGGVELSVLHTPGHTPEHVSYVADGLDLFSGGSLIVGGAARTDLVDPARIADLTRSQFQSIRRLATLPEGTVLYPTHGSGSFCSAGTAQTAGTTVGQQRRTNPLLLIDDEDAFVEAFTEGFGSFPPYFLHLRPVNREPMLLSDLPPARPMSAMKVAEAVAEGAWLIDARTVDAWAFSHPVGAISNAIRPEFASWLGWIVPFGEPVVLLADEGDLSEGLRQARRIGYDRVLGWIEGGIEAWTAAGFETRTAEQIGAVEAKRRQERGDVILDVRQRSELANRVPASVHIELGELIVGGTDGLGGAGDVIVHCGHGERSATGVSLLERYGVRAANLDGGIQAWREAGLPLAS